MIFPVIAPIEKNAPIHDNSVNVMLPVVRGEFSDCKMRKDGDSHPIALP